MLDVLCEAGMSLLFGSMVNYAGWWFSLDQVRALPTEPLQVLHQASGSAAVFSLIY